MACASPQAFFSGGFPTVGCPARTINTTRFLSNAVISGPCTNKSESLTTLSYISISKTNNSLFLRSTRNLVAFLSPQCLEKLQTQAPSIQALHLWNLQYLHSQMNQNRLQEQTGHVH